MGSPVPLTFPSCRRRRHLCPESFSLSGEKDSGPSAISGAAWACRVGRSRALARSLLPPAPRPALSFSRETSMRGPLLSAGGPLGPCLRPGHPSGRSPGPAGPGLRPPPLPLTFNCRCLAFRKYTLAQCICMRRLRAHTRVVKKACVLEITFLAPCICMWACPRSEPTTRMVNKSELGARAGLTRRPVRT